MFCTVIFNSLNSPQRGCTIVLNLEGESERVNIITQVDGKTRFEPGFTFFYLSMLHLSLSILARSFFGNKHAIMIQNLNLYIQNIKAKYVKNE